MPPSVPCWHESVIDLRQLRTCSSRVIREATVGPNVIFPARSWVAPVSLSSLQQWGRVNTDHTPSTVRFRAGQAQGGSEAWKQVHSSAHAAFQNPTSFSQQGKNQENCPQLHALFPILFTEQVRGETTSLVSKHTPGSGLLSPSTSEEHLSHDP